MKYPEEVKQEVIKRLNNGDKVKEISSDMSISPATIYGWKKKFGNTIGEKTNSDEKVAKIVSEDVESDAEKERRRQKLLDVLKAKIVYDKIEPADVEEIRQSEVLSQYEKTICLLAICEKFNMQKEQRHLLKNLKQMIGIKEK